MVYVKKTKVNYKLEGNMVTSYNYPNPHYLCEGLPIY